MKIFALVIVLVIAFAAAASAKDPRCHGNAYPNAVIPGDKHTKGFTAFTYRGYCQSYQAHSRSSGNQFSSITECKKLCD